MADIGKVDGLDAAAGGGDMLKSTYDPNGDGVIALAQLDTGVCSETEADSKISTHAGIATDHHSNTNDPSSDEKAALAGTSGTPATGNEYVTNDDSRNSDARTPSAHSLGGAEHSADTLANLNAKVSDATLDDSSSARTPSAHNLGGAEHGADTLANLNSKVSDATLDDSSSARTPSAHKTSHQNGGADEISLASLSGDPADTINNSLLTTRGDLVRMGASAPERVALGSDGTILSSDGTDAVWEDNVFAIELVINGGGSEITTGVWGYAEVPFACTINRVTLMADQSGSIVIDVWKDTYANFPPTDADSITASAPPTITTAQKSQDSTLTGWTTAITAGDILAFNVDSCTTIEFVTISLKVTKT